MEKRQHSRKRVNSHGFLLFLICIFHDEIFSATLSTCLCSKYFTSLHPVKLFIFTENRVKSLPGPFPTLTQINAVENISDDERFREGKSITPTGEGFFFSFFKIPMSCLIFRHCIITVIIIHIGKGILNMHIRSGIKGLLDGDDH